MSQEVNLSKRISHLIKETHGGIRENFTRPLPSILPTIKITEVGESLS